MQHVLCALLSAAAAWHAPAHTSSRLLALRGGSSAPSAPEVVASSPIDLGSAAVEEPSGSWNPFSRPGRPMPPQPPKPPPSPAPSSGPAPPRYKQALQLSLSTAQKGKGLILSPLLAILTFKPPVGALIVLKLYRALKGKSILEDASSFFPTSWSRSRSLFVDAGDREYEVAGGVHAVRVELYHTLLSNALEAEQATATPTPSAAAQKDGGADEPIPTQRFTPGVGWRTHSDAPPPTRSAWRTTQKKALLAGLELSCGPGSSREAFVRRSGEQLAYLRAMRTPPPPATGPGSAPSDGPPAGAGNAESAGERPTATDRASSLGAPVEALIELRTADALARLLRDKLLLSAKILEQANAEAHARVRSYARRMGGRGKMKRMVQERLRAQRQQLALTSALYKRQLERLGEVQHLLLIRPPKLSATVLVALRTGSHEEGDGGAEAADDTSTRSDDESGYDGGSESEPGDAGADADDDAMWVDEASAWTARARALVASIVSETVESVTAKLEDHAEKPPAASPAASRGSSFRAAHFEPFGEPLAMTEARLQRLGTWAATGEPEGWLAALALVEGLPQAQRAQRNLLPGYEYLHSYTRMIPSSIGTVIGGFAVHYALKPRWPHIVAGGLAARTVAHGIFERRFYAPLKDIVLDLLNRRTRLTDAAALADSQTSLGLMLGEFFQEQRGGKAPGDRAAALAEVSRAYEREIKKGIRSVVRGKLMRLMLIQVQLLKTELLKAMGAIDDLVDANRLNVQLLASVPAVLLLIVTSRVPLQLVQLMRKGGIRSMHQVHEEMSDMLSRMERCLLLAGSSARPQKPPPAAAVPQDDGDDDNASPASPPGAPSWPWQRRPTTPVREGTTGSPADGAEAEVPPATGPVLEGIALGEFVLHVHSYLLLLDFSAPARSSKASDAIHRELQDLLRHGTLSVHQQAALLRSVKERQAALTKALR